MAKAGTGRFEGWYFKHSAEGKVYSFIPGLAVGTDGEKSAFLQVITQEGSHFFRFPAESFHSDPQKLRVEVGDSVFGASGAEVSVSQEGIRISGKIRYSPLQLLQRSLYCPTVMGPFSYLRFLECSHDVVSMRHGLTGTLTINEKPVELTGGTGYIERDAGRSFPRAWLWYQSNCFPEPGDGVMLAAARVPVGSAFSFPGLLCVCHAGGREYRLATYCGGRLERVLRREREVGLVARQGGDRLEVRVRADAGRELRAPLLGDMSRVIREFPCCNSAVRLTRNGKVLLQGVGKCAGFEQIGGLDEILP